jgi:hypothetical protein
MNAATNAATNIPAVVAGGRVELADPGQLAHRVGIAQRVRGAGEPVVAEVGVVDRDPNEAGQDPERGDRGDAATVLIDVERGLSPWRRCASSGFLPFTRVTDSSKCATPASIAPVIAVFASATARLTRVQASATQPSRCVPPAALSG